MAAPAWFRRPVVTNRYRPLYCNTIAKISCVAQAATGPTTWRRYQARGISQPSSKVPPNPFVHNGGHKKATEGSLTRRVQHSLKRRGPEGPHARPPCRGSRAFASGPSRMKRRELRPLWTKSTGVMDLVHESLLCIESYV